MHVIHLQVFDMRICCTCACCTLKLQVCHTYCTHLEKSNICTIEFSEYVYVSVAIVDGPYQQSSILLEVA